MGASNFKIEWTPATKTTETLLWTIQRSKLEIHVVMLEQVELNDIVPHCLGVLHKIDSQVGLDSDDQRVRFYLQVLPQTMSMLLQSYWKQVLTDYDKTHEDYELSLLVMQLKMTAMISLKAYAWLANPKR
jgi:hypothetical protein